MNLEKLYFLCEDSTASSDLIKKLKKNENISPFCYFDLRKSKCDVSELKISAKGMCSAWSVGLIDKVTEKLIPDLLIFPDSEIYDDFIAPLEDTATRKWKNALVINNKVINKKEGIPAANKQVSIQELKKNLEFKNRKLLPEAGNYQTAFFFDDLYYDGKTIKAYAQLFQENSITVSKYYVFVFYKKSENKNIAINKQYSAVYYEFLKTRSEKINV